MLVQLKAYDTPDACLHARACVSYILESLFEMLPEAGRKDLVKAIVGILTSGQHGELLVTTAMRALDAMVLKLGPSSSEVFYPSA